jgi:hypothetical protein
LADLSAEGRQVRLRAEARLVEADVVDGDSDAEDGAA